MTDEPDWITAIRNRANAATPGPWDVHAHQHGAAGCRCLSCYDDPTGFVVDHKTAMSCEERAHSEPNDFGRDRKSCDEGPLLSWDDAYFAACARQDIPQLLAYIDELRNSR